VKKKNAALAKRVENEQKKQHMRNRREKGAE
jgi:hypothetical protein